MRKTLFVLGILVSLAGCSSPAPSLHSLITKEQAVTLPDISGAWIEQKEQPEEGSGAVYTFEQQKDHEYKLTVQDPDEESTCVFDVRLARLGGYLFVDGVVKEGAVGGKKVDTNGLWIPVHYFGRIDIGQDQIHIRLLSADWLDKALKEGRTNLRYEEIEGDNLLVASTDDLQAFAIQYGWDEEAFSFPLNLLRQKQPSH